MSAERVGGRKSGESEREREKDRRIQVDSPRNLGDESDTKYMKDTDRRVGRR